MNDLKSPGFLLDFVANFNYFSFNIGAYDSVLRVKYHFLMKIEMWSNKSMLTWVWLLFAKMKPVGIALMVFLPLLIILGIILIFINKKFRNFIKTYTLNMVQYNFVLRLLKETMMVRAIGSFSVFFIQYHSFN